MATLAVVGGTLLDGRGGDPIHDCVVTITDGKFDQVGARNGSTPQADKVIDAKGKFVIPGYVNANIHLLDGIMFMTTGSTEYCARFEGRFHEVIEEGAQIALAAGMTTVFDTWNALNPVLYARDRLNSGKVPGARLYCAGNIVGMGGPFSADFLKGARQFVSRTFADRIDDLFAAGVGRRLAALPPNELRPIIRDYLQTGVDFLKYAVSDHILAEAANPHLTFSARQERVICEETRAAGKPLLTHTVAIEAMNNAIENDVDIMIHATITSQVPIPDDFIERMIKQTVWAEIQPVTDGHQCMMERTNDPWSLYAGGVHKQNTIRLIQAKAPILMGTDAGCTDPDVLHDLSPEQLKERPWTLGKDHFMWFRAMGQMGMKPMDMLLAATSNVAKAYDKDHLLGSVQPGLFGDLVILDANPLDDYENFSRINTVIQNGNIVDRASLPNPKVVTRYPRGERL